MVNALEAGFLTAAQRQTDARWNNLRTQPRFLALAQRMGLEAERAHGRY